MRGRSIIARVGLVLLLCCVPATAYADSTVPETKPTLIVQELNITGDEFIVLRAGADIAHLNEYWLGYVSDDVAVPPPAQQLPDVPLDADQSLLLTGGGNVELCGVRYVTNLSPSLANTSGSIALWHMQDTSFERLSGTQMTVRWAKSTKTKPLDMQTHEIDIATESNLTKPAWFYDTTTSVWRVANVDANCQLTIPANDPTQGVTVLVTWPGDSAEPPAIIESTSEQQSSNGPSIPAADIGLQPPRITELLANPTGTGNEDTDEFIELYNPNASPFDLSGFVLQTGLTTKHSYTFLAGTKLAPKSFHAYYSAETGLSLSNTGSQADLQDPLGTVITQSDPYTSAPDGQAWALANGDWYWTTKPTPGATNDIAAPIVKSASATSKVTSSKSSVKGASTTAASKSSGNTSTLANTTEASTNSQPVHPLVLAGIGVIAVAYGLYEYRQDLANAVHKFRRNRSTRR